MGHSRKLTWKLQSFQKGTIRVSMLVWGSVLASSWDSGLRVQSLGFRSAQFKKGVEGPRGSKIKVQPLPPMLQKCKQSQGWSPTGSRILVTVLAPSCFRRVKSANSHRNWGGLQRGPRNCHRV